MYACNSALGEQGPDLAKVVTQNQSLNWKRKNLRCSEKGCLVRRAARGGGEIQGR